VLVAPVPTRWRVVKNQKDGIDKVDLHKTSAHPPFADTRLLGSGGHPKNRDFLTDPGAAKACSRLEAADLPADETHLPSNARRGLDLVPQRTACNGNPPLSYPRIVQQKWGHRTGSTYSDTKCERQPPRCQGP
jgi:hypothetical protein